MKSVSLHVFTSQSVSWSKSFRNPGDHTLTHCSAQLSEVWAPVNAKERFPFQGGSSPCHAMGRGKQELQQTCLHGVAQAKPKGEKHLGMGRVCWISGEEDTTADRLQSMHMVHMAWVWMPACSAPQQNASSGAVRTGRNSQISPLAVDLQPLIVSEWQKNTWPFHEK